jgi:phage terminase large subunit GpA-like protein
MSRGSKAPKSKKKSQNSDTAIDLSHEDSRHVMELLASLFEQREVIKPSDWQEEFRISPPGSPRPGRWRNYIYQVEPFDAITDESCSSMTLMWASQFLGKSSIIEGDLGWMIDQAPCTCLVVMPTSDNAQAWSKNRFGQLIESTERLAKLVDSAFSRKGTRSGYGQNTVAHKRFPGGWILAVGSNSGANLRAHTVKLIVFDEVDGYEASAGDEGDPVTLAEQRTARFPDAFSIKTSTPTIKHFSRIEKAMESTDYRKWTCKCPSCDHDWVIMFGDIKWPKSKDKDQKTVHLIKEAYLQCPTCDAKFDDHQRMEMVEKGKWIASRPENDGSRGYWANAFIVLGPHGRGFASWLHYFAKRFLDAKLLGTQGEVTFQNLICAETYESESLQPPDYQILFNRRELYPEIDGEVVLPERGLFLVASADVQLDRIEAEIVCYGLSEEAWGIEYKVFRGGTETPALWNQFDQWIQKKWKHPSGHMLWPACVCIDSGNKPKPVYDYSYRCAPRQVYAIKGDRGYVANWVARSAGKNQRLFILKVDTPKENLYSRLRLGEYGPGYQHFPSNPQCGYDATYFQQLCSESMRVAYVRGRYAPYFDVIHSGARNESLDTRVYGMAAKEILNVDYDEVQKNLATVPLNDWRPRQLEPPKPIELLVAPPMSTIDSNKSQIFVPRRPKSGWSNPF